MIRFGVNYTPSQGWFHSWLDLSESDVARDLEQLAGLGIDHVRIFPLWPVLQPNRTLINRAGLRDVTRVVELAASFGLDVSVDALQGHLSSFDFLPSWVSTWHRRNIFTDPDVVTSTANYVRILGDALADQPNVIGLTIGNELNQFAHAPHPDPDPLTPGEGHTWLATMVTAAREGLGARPVSVAQYDAAWYDDAQPFGPEHAVEHGDLTVTHSWVFNGAARAYGALGPGSVRHAEYLMRLAAAFSPDSHRGNWLQEVGAPTNVVPETDAAEFCERTIRHAVRVPNVYGVTWWCSHDVSRRLADFPELEYDLGLFTNDGRRKAIGERFADLIAEFRTTPPVPDESADTLVLDDVDTDGRARPDVRASCAPGGSFARAWIEAAGAEGAGPSIALKSLPAAPPTARNVNRPPVPHHQGVS